jgi:hypothetical protein
VAIGFLAGFFQQFFNETRGFEFVELADGFAEPVLRELVDFLFVEFVLLHDFENELLLLFTAGPIVVSLVVVPVAVAVAVPISVSVPTALLDGNGVGEKTRLLNLAVNTRLHEGIQPGAFLWHLVDVTEFGSEGDGILVAAVLRQAEFLGVVGFDVDGHDWMELMVLGLL